MPEALTIPEMVKVAAIPYRTLDGWVRTGLIHVEPDTDSRGRRRLNKHEAFFAYAAAELRRRGLSLQVLRTVIAEQRKVWPLVDTMREAGAVVSGGTAFYQGSKELVTWTWMDLAQNFRAEVAKLRGEPVQAELALAGTEEAGNPA